MRVVTVMETGDVRVLAYRDGASDARTALLAREAGVPAAALVVRRDERGRPAIVEPETDLRFSASHSGGTTLLALARGLDVGVDAERTDRDVTDWRLWAQALTASELARLPVMRSARNLALLEAWVAKEAILKAAGVGLAVDPREVELHPSGQVAALPPALGSPPEWSIRRLRPRGLVAAVAHRPTSGTEVR